MPIANLHLLHISPTVPPPVFLRTLLSTEPAPLTVSIPIRWLFMPKGLPDATSTPLARTPWSVLFITLSTGLPQSIQDNLLEHYQVQVGVPSRLIQNFETKNHALLHPDPASIPPLNITFQNSHHQLSERGQAAELPDGLLRWIEANDFGSRHGRAGWRTGPVSMLNFMAFKAGGQFKESYVKYGQAFANDIGKRRGGIAKLIGAVIHRHPSASEESSSKTASTSKSLAAKEDRDWDDFALATYPSLKHFADMVASEDYQVVNKRDRLPALEDTCVLFTSELLVEDILKMDNEATMAKL